MFYKKEEANLALICSICSHIFQDADPRVLPCGESACQSCIQNACDSNNQFKCSSCHENHQQVAEKGFPVNKGLLKLMKTKADQVYRNKKVVNLGSKLAQIKTKVDELESKFENDIREHCIQLKNQVHLQTDVLIEQIYQFDEAMIAEIDEYEKKCVGSFDPKFLKQKSLSKQLREIIEFFDKNSRYLKEFQIDDKQIESALVVADKHLKQLKQENYQTNKIIFSGPLMKFNKNKNKLDKSQLGSLLKTSANFDFECFQKLEFSKEIVQNYRSNFHLFKNGDGTNSVFYMDLSNYVNIATFDNNGQVNIQIQNLFNDTAVKQLKVVRLGEYYAIQVNLMLGVDTCHFRTQQKIALNNTRNCLFIINKKMNFVKHLQLSSISMHMAANSSNLFCIDFSNQMFMYDSKLNLVQEEQLDILSGLVGQNVVDVNMNDQNLFVLCDIQTLKIFNAKTLSLLKEISVNANIISLVSNDYLVLFNSTSRMIHLYDQNGPVFDLKESALLDDKIEAGFVLASDKAKCFTFYNHTQMKYLTFA
jgi:hypothetical protein